MCLARRSINNSRHNFASFAVARRANPIYRRNNRAVISLNFSVIMYQVLHTLLLLGNSDPNLRLLKLRDKK